MICTCGHILSCNICTYEAVVNIATYVASYADAIVSEA